MLLGWDFGPRPCCASGSRHCAKKLIRVGEDVRFVERFSSLTRVTSRPESLHFFLHFILSKYRFA